MKDEQVILRAGRNSVGVPLIVAELDKQVPMVELLKDGADLPTGKPMPRKVCQQSHDIQE
jgi:hypothetical protein